jgi:hypothetical protein
VRRNQPAPLRKKSVSSHAKIPGFFFLEHRDPTEGLIRLEIR